MNLYAVYDLLAGEAGPVFQAKNDQVALRQYRNLVKGEGINMSEYELYSLGVYDPEKLLIIVHDKVKVEDVKNGQ